MKTLKDLKLTENQNSFLLALIASLYAEPNFTDVSVKTLSEKMGISVNKTKGILGTLVTRGIVETETFESSKTKMVGKKITFVTEKTELIILAYDYWHLHPIWKNAIN